MPEARIVLREGAPGAQVEHGGRSWDVPLFHDGALLEDGVLLRPGLDVALARVGGLTLGELPVYRERGDGSLARVRVRDIVPR